LAVSREPTALSDGLVDELWGLTTPICVLSFQRFWEH